MTQQLVPNANIVVLSSSVEGIRLDSKQLSNRFIRSVLASKYYPCQLKRDNIIINYIMRDLSLETKISENVFFLFQFPTKLKRLHLKYCVFVKETLRQWYILF